jgi:hypothetical protein
LIIAKRPRRYAVYSRDVGTGTAGGLGAIAARAAMHRNACACPRSRLRARAVTGVRHSVVARLGQAWLGRAGLADWFGGWLAWWLAVW